MDPIGTVRREDHHDDGEPPGYSIWVRMQPTYPDDQLPDTEWTCLWSTSAGNLGVRQGDSITQYSEVVGQVPGSPAETGSDVHFHDTVLVDTSVAVWADEPQRGRVEAVQPANGILLVPLFQISGTTPDGRDIYLHRRDFTLLETDFDESTEG